LAELKLPAVLEMATPVVELDGKTPAAAIAAVRAAGASLREKLNAIRRAVPTKDEQDDAIAAYVVQQRQRPDHPKVTIISDRLYVDWRGSTVAEEAFRLLCRTDAERACEYLESRLGPVTGAMPKVERLRQEAELEAALERAERFEEQAICFAAESGTEVLRRPDADPKCVLGLAIKQEAQAVA
jgi:hypothetical protein